MLMLMLMLTCEVQDTGLSPTSPDENDSARAVYTTSLMR